MKSYLALGLATAMASTVAFAQEKVDHKLNLDLRFDNNTSVKKVGSEDAVGTGQTVSLQTARFKLTGDIGDAGKYVARVNNAGTNLEFDRLYFEHNIHPMFTLRAGLLKTIFGGVERMAYDGAIDMYTQSAFGTFIGTGYDLTADGNMDIGGVLSGKTGGVNLIITPVADHTVTVEIADAKNAKHGDRNVAVMYRGKVDAGAAVVNPIVTYNNIRHADHFDTAYTLGAQVAVADASVDVEYNTYAQAKDDKKGIDELNVSGYILNVGYDVKPFGVKPLVKYAAHTFKGETGDPTTMTNMSAAVEYRPTAMNLRYHAAYVSEKTDDGSEVVSTKYVIGAALKI